MSSAMNNNSMKRTREAEEKGPFKKIAIQPTGLEDDPILKDVTSRSASPTTLRQVEIYARRRKIINYAAQIRKKQSMSKKVRGDWAGMPTSAQQGLKNLTGTLCYRLSLLQALLHQPRFVNWLQDQHQPEKCVSDHQNRCVCCCLRSMSFQYWKGTPGGTLKILQDMDALFKSLGWASDTSSGHADPDEMATWIFTQLSREIPSSFYSCLEGMTQPAIAATVSCGRCGHESKTTGHQDGALPIPIIPTIRNGTVAQYLQQYMVEKVEDYRCEGCNDNTAAKQRKQVINYAPQILSFQLKRTDAYGRKILTPVTINQTLDLSRYHNINEESLKYELSGIIKHRGSLEFGHYICFAKAGDRKWYCFDDRRKTPSNFAAATSHADKFTPYMLFFQRMER